MTTSCGLVQTLVFVNQFPLNIKVWTEARFNYAIGYGPCGFERILKAESPASVG